MESIDENIFFRNATIRICGSLNIEKAMLNCLTYIADFLPACGMIIGLYEPEQDTLRCIAEVLLKGEKKLIVPPTMKVSKKIKFLIEEFWSDDTETIHIINEPEKDIMTKIFLKRNINEKLTLSEKNMSFIGLRLIIDNNQIGGLIVYNRKKQIYTKEHEKLIKLLHAPFTIAMSNILGYQKLIKLKEIITDENRFLRRELLDLSGDRIIGSNSGLKNVVLKAKKVAPLQSPVLLLGETGVGKEIIANLIHYTSMRKDKPFIKVNCGALAESLIDSELFGHEKGAFTSASSLKRGRFERANHGTIFLDEIGELPLCAQVKLLRVLQHQEIERVGGTETITVNIRIICATNRNIEEMMKSRSFRNDLWFRLNVFPIVIPALRERKQDIPELIHYFIKRKAKDLKLKSVPKPSWETIEHLSTYDWPGNVRELENIIERSLILAQGRHPSEVLNFEIPSNEIKNKKNNFSVKIDQQKQLPLLDEINITYIKQVLNLTRGKIHGPGGAAEILGLNPNTLRTRMEKLGISFKRRQKLKKSPER